MMGTIAPCFIKKHKKKYKTIQKSQKNDKILKRLQKNNIGIRLKDTSNIVKLLYLYID